MSSYRAPLRPCLATSCRRQKRETTTGRGTHERRRIQSSGRGGRDRLGRGVPLAAPLDSRGGARNLRRAAVVDLPLRRGSGRARVRGGGGRGGAGARGLPPAVVDRHRRLDARVAAAARDRGPDAGSPARARGGREDRLRAEGADVRAAALRRARAGRAAGARPAAAARLLAAGDGPARAVREPGRDRARPPPAFAPREGRARHGRRRRRGRRARRGGARRADGRPARSGARVPLRARGRAEAVNENGRPRGRPFGGVNRFRELIRASRASRASRTRRTCDPRRRVRRASRASRACRRGGPRCRARPRPRRAQSCSPGQTLNLLSRLLRRPWHSDHKTWNAVPIFPDFFKKTTGREILRWVNQLRKQLSESGVAFRAVFANRELRKLQLAFVGSITGEWGFLVALVVYADGHGGAKAVSLVLVIRWISAALTAPWLAYFADRYPRERVMLVADVSRVA